MKEQRGYIRFFTSDYIDTWGNQGNKTHQGPQLKLIIEDDTREVKMNTKHKRLSK